ncbi:ADP-ribosylation factor family-domain-containing protein [Fusarium tricinctum]|uniref:ADP-ribosylation factor n=1 Tax=Fusarium tricinctum TaxID=61284 RepID=A0A8K0WCW3_9HYPO|nr:ADP-ribosylation factor family-domain-containing protein [Fusarium tricinctum]
MGGTISRLWTSEPIWVGLVGIQSAGKTAIVYRLSGNNAPVTPSTDTVTSTPIYQASQHFDLLDYTSEPKIRPAWRSFMTRVHAVVFVIDSTDRDTLPEAKTELLYLLKEIMLDHQPFLIFANKQDIPKAMSTAELTEFLDIQQYLDRDLKCCVQGSSAVTGDGLTEGLEWVRQAVTARQK